MRAAGIADLDVTHEADWVETVGTAVHRYGKLDILVNNAGIVLRKGIEDTSEADWDRIMAVNAKGVFLGTKHAIPAMRRAGGGSMVNISSISGLVAIGPPAYIASKGAVRLFTKVTAIQHAHDNIRCNSVHPGGVVRVMAQALDHTGITVNAIAPGGTASPTLLAVRPNARVGTM